MKKRFAFFIVLIFSSLAFADTVQDMYAEYKAGNSAETFNRELNEYKSTREYSVISIQQPRMAELVDAMSKEKDAAAIDSLMIEYLEVKENVLLKNQQHILFVTLLLSLLIFIIVAIIFYMTLFVEKRRIAREILLELEKERTRVSFELHDTIAQEITGASLMLKSGGKTDEIIALLDKARSEIRRILSALNPPALKESSTQVLINELCTSFQKASGIECKVNFTEDFSSIDLNEEEKLNIFRIVQESLTNIRKHAKAKPAQVIFRTSGTSKNSYVFFICDDGCGFDTARPAGGKDKENHFGLKSINQRVAILGGVLKITSSPGNGTDVRVEVRK